MKKKNRILLLAITLLVCVTACKKSVDTETVTPVVPPNVKDTTQSAVIDTTAAVSYPQLHTVHCPGAPSYGDTILFLQNAPTDYIIAPVNHPDSGTYISWPKGMVIDKNTGAINVSKSETGVRYNIGWVKKGTTDTCLQTLILAGISYADSLYVLNNDERYAKPYYNASTTADPVCVSASGVPGSGSNCKFDVTGQAASQKVIVDKDYGIIDLKNTANKAFGLLPLNGTKVTTTISYQLDDNSAMATQKITVNLIYYNKKSDVPPDLLALVTDKLNKIVNSVLLINLLGDNSAQYRGSPRPPIIIVTRSAL